MRTLPVQFFSLIVTILITSACSAPGLPNALAVSIDQSGPVDLVEGGRLVLTATVAIVGGASPGLVWSSDDPTVASIHGTTGLVTGVAPGFARISVANAADDTELDSVIVRVLRPMTITVDTTLGHRPSRTARLPLRGDVDVAIDWGDGAGTTAVMSGDVTHTYAADGRYTVRISGSLTQFGAGAATSLQPSAAITSVDSWGDLGLRSLSGALAGTQHLTSVPSSLPPTVTDLSHLFQRSEFDEPMIGSWNVSNVTDMRSMFRQSAFDQAIEGWDVANVTDMSSMFLDGRFNHPLGAWDVSSVRSMRSMFGGLDHGSRFDRPIGGWDVSNVTDMSGMFAWSAFDQDIGSWDVSNVEDMSWMFAEADFRSHPIAAWNVGRVIDMSGMFFNAPGFNQDIGRWDVSNVTDMSWMFGGHDDAGTGFNRDLDEWDVSKVTNMRGMFANSAFNGRIVAWDVSKVTDMSHMFRGASGASRFDQDISGWDVSSVTAMDGMFDTASEFNQDLSRWCVINVTVEPPDFATRADSWNLGKPNWGHCPNRD